MPVHVPFWGLGCWGTFPPNDVTYRPNPKMDRHWADPCHLSHKVQISVARFELALVREKKDRTEKKSRKGYNSPICGEAPTKAISINNC